MLQPQQLFADRYRVVRPLAEGGMGAVFVAEHTATEALVALKVLWPRVMESERARRSFELEARIAARVRSEHIVKVLDAGLDAATRSPFLVMELLDGVTLADRVWRDGPQPWADVVTWVNQAARGLDAAHGYRNSAGVPEPIVHRDLKPENLFLSTGSDSAPLVKILDFGIAKVLGESTELSQEVRGTPLYMAPEQVTREPITPKTDVWALGLTAYFLLTGRCYWRSVDQVQALFAEMLSLPMPPASERAREDHPTLALPPGFDAWLFGCIDRDPNRRFASAGDAARALAALTGSAGAARASVASESSIAAAPLSTLHLPADAGHGPPPRLATAGSVPSLTTAVAERARSTGAPRTPRRRWLAVGFGGLLVLSVGGAWLGLGRQAPEPVAPVTASPTWTRASAGSAPAPGVRELETQVVSPPPRPAPADDSVDAGAVSQRAPDVAPIVVPGSAAIPAPSAGPRAASVSRSRARAEPSPGRPPARSPSTPASNARPTFVELPP